MLFMKRDAAIPRIDLDPDDAIGRIVFELFLFSSRVSRLVVSRPEIFARENLISVTVVTICMCKIGMTIDL